MIPEVIPLKVDSVHVYVRCPYCLKVHLHGSNGGSHYGGHRGSHCDVKVGSNPGYVIRELVGSGG